MSDWLGGVRAVVFDAVGTLIVPSPGVAEVYSVVAARHGVTADRDEIAGRFRRAFAAEERADEAAGWAVDECREVDRWRSIVRGTLGDVPDQCFRDLYDHFARPSAWALIPGAIELLAALQSSGRSLGIASNFDARLVAIARAIPALQVSLGWVVVSSRVGVRKPHPEFFAAVVGAAGCRHDEILFVGDDRRNDYDGATASRLRAVLIDPDRRHLDVDRRVDRLVDLVDTCAS